MKKIILSLMLILVPFIITGCENKESNTNNESKQEEKKIENNAKVGYLKFYVPEDYTYKPDLRGLMYSEDERKLYIKGNENDRSDAIIIDANYISLSYDINTYVEMLNKAITDGNIFKEKDINGTTFYAREDFKGNSNGNIVINYKYITIKNKYLYTFIISGPESKKEEVNTLKDLELKVMRLD